MHDEFDLTAPRGGRFRLLSICRPALIAAAVFVCWVGTIAAPATAVQDTPAQGRGGQNPVAPDQPGPIEVDLGAVDETTQGLWLTPRAFRAAAEKIRPSLVTIESFGGVSTVRGQIGGIRKRGEGNTTGVVLSSDGYVVTSTFNFISRPPVITVVTQDGKRRIAELLGRDETRKLCLLKIDGVDDLVAPQIAPLEEITVGQWAISVGVGYGDANSAMSMGIISAKNRVGGRALQTDANVSPANYGGPLLDLDGRVMGICVPMNPNSNAIGAGVEWYDSGIGFAVPLDGQSELIEQLKDGRVISPAFLGVVVGANPAGDGVRVERVVEGGPADEGGIIAGDVIRRIGPHWVADVVSLRVAINRYTSGDQAEFEVDRAAPADADEKAAEGDAGQAPPDAGGKNAAVSRLKLTVAFGTPPQPQDAPKVPDFNNQ